MNIYPYYVLILGVISCTMFLIYRDRKGSIKALFLKTITSFLFISVAFTSYIVNSNQNSATFAMLIMMGLICGLIGDIILDLKVLYFESSSLYQHGGTVSFFIGHLFYLTALFIFFGFNWIPLAAAIAIALIIILFTKFILKFDFKEHANITYLYSIVLSYMMTQACYAAITQGYTLNTIFLAIGSVLFLLSDLIISMTFFDNKDSKPYIVSNHLFYYAAQFLIALSILYV